MTVNPFTARSGIDPRIFIGRREELDFFKDRLLNAIKGRSRHYVITGIWGIGKTVLLRQMKMMAQQNGVWTLLFCTRSFGEQENLRDFVRHVLDMAASELPVQPKKKGRRIQSAGASVLGFGLQFGWRSSESGEKDPQILLRDGLLQMYEHAHANGSKGLLLMLDDIHNLPGSGHHLTLLRNVLTDTKIAGKINLLVVLSSIEQGWAPYLMRDHPVGRLFMPKRSLNFFDKDATRRLIDESLQGTGVTFEEVVKDLVFEFSSGHVFEIQALCEALFDRHIKGKVTIENWNAALRHTLLALADAQFEGMLARASEQEATALYVLAGNDSALGPRDLEKIDPAIKNTAEVLRRLVEKGLCARIKRGTYGIRDRLFAEYVKYKAMR